jgi:integrase
MWSRSSSPRVSELETAQVGDLDEHRRAIRVRWTVGKNDRYRHLELPDDLFAAIVRTLPEREVRNLDAPLFSDLDEAALRTAPVLRQRGKGGDLQGC